MSRFFARISTRPVPTVLMRAVLAASCCLLALVVPAFAQDTGITNTTLADLEFMAGSWRGGNDAVTLEELWTPPRGGIMLGLNRTVTPRGTQFEFLRLEERAADDGQTEIVYWASPGGKKPTPFPLAEVGPGRAVFANPEHDFPQRIIYTRDGDTLHARVEAGEGDAVRGFDLRWRLAAILE